MILVNAFNPGHKCIARDIQVSKLNIFQTRFAILWFEHDIDGVLIGPDRYNPPNSMTYGAIAFVHILSVFGRCTRELFTFLEDRNSIPFAT